jgi:hypothetical protein
MTMRPILILAIFLFLVTLNFSCKDDHPFLESDGGFPTSPVNLTFFNSEYDDYNSNLPPGEGGHYALTFSSKRESKGRNFDFVQESMGISYNSDENTLSLGRSWGYPMEYVVISDMLPTVNTNNDELGPFILNLNFKNDPSNYEYLFLYTRKTEDQLDLKFMTHELDSIDRLNAHLQHYGIHGEYDVNILNTEKNNEGYISISGDKLYYCSDIGGTFDIYELAIDTSIGIKEFLIQKKNLQTKAKKIVSSSFDDKCPCVVRNFMVFTSNREGGNGGYDLWYCKKINDEWGEPLNFGSAINSPADEYRPIFQNFEIIPNDLMIFSSNREGGLGGFDLYYTGIDIIP